MNRFFFILILGVLFFGCEKDNDTVAPAIESSTPLNYSTEVALDVSITVTYNEIVFLEETHQININDEKVSASVLGNTLTIEKKLESGKSYKVTIPNGAIRDASGNYASTFSFNFKTQTVVSINSTLATPNPSTNALKLYNYLKENYGKKILSSTMAKVSWNNSEAEWLFSHTKKYPAMNGYDLIFINYSPTNWINYEDITPVEEWWLKNGIVSLCWHWNVPKSNGSSQFTFRVEQTTFDVSNTTIEGSWENTVVKADLAEAAGIIKRLQDKGIPVLWRPLHEASGGWFWWSRNKKPEPCIKLYKMMFNYFKEQGINNLIWVWNSAEPAWYPGDEYVDIISHDIYDKSSATEIAVRFNTAQNNYPSKIIALSECGNVATISNQWSNGAKWSYFMPWYDPNLIAGSEKHMYADINWWKDAFNSEVVITRDELPDLK